MEATITASTANKARRPAARRCGASDAVTCSRPGVEAGERHVGRSVLPAALNFVHQPLRLAARLHDQIPTG